MKHAPQKLLAYQTLFTLNQAFENVLADLHRLQRLPFFRLEFLREFQVMAEETRACVNFELVESLHSREQDDWTALDGCASSGRSGTEIQRMCSLRLSG